MSKMKSYLLAAALVLTGACGGKQAEDNAGAPLSVSPTSADFVALGEIKNFSVTSSTDWLARSSQNWLKVKTASGKGGASASVLTVEAEENKTAEERTAVLSVTNLGKESIEVGIRQAAGGNTPEVRGISTAEDLVAFARAVNGDGSIAKFLVDGAVKFNNDIDASSIKEWIPAGTQTNPLTYNVDGNNKTIKNVNWKVDATKFVSIGLIGCAKGVTISRLKFGDATSKVEISGNTTEKIRAGGIIGRAEGVTLEKLTNNAALTVSGTTATGNNLILGGIAGYADSASILGNEEDESKACINTGDITASVAGQLGGLVGYNSGAIYSCTNRGTVKCPSEGSYGPAWLCSYNATKDKLVNNKGYGFVGSAPAMPKNAVVNYENFDPEQNSVDWTLDAYYDWTEVERKQLHSGATYYHYSCTNLPREIFLVEVNLKDPGIEVTTAYAGEMIPNPNNNGNDNNGFNLRERLSDVCARRRAEGQKILIGFNSGFFDSNDGISRGFHVEEGQPAYINNPAVVSSLGNHVWGITVFTDGTASCGKKAFSGKMRAGGKEYKYNSVNDTIMRHTSSKYQANLYTSRYVKVPYPSKPKITNELAKDAMYVICEYTSAPMTVNTGYAAAKVVQIVDGRNSSITPPYISAKNRVGIALSGDMASEWSGFIKVGDNVEFRCDIAVDGDASKPIFTQNSTMYQLMTNGQDASNTPGSGASLYTKYDPKTFPVVSADRSKLWIVEVDGRQGWYSMGLKGYEMYRIAKKLGGAWVTGLDGGGSSAVWLWNASAGSGKIVNKPSDSKGERSCLNYLLVREK